MKHHSGENYINVQQTITGNYNKEQLKINPSILPDIICVLQMYQKEISLQNSNICKNYFSEEKQKSVVKMYLNGVSIDGLALQFDCTTQIIKQILFNKGIDIVDQNKPEPVKRFRDRRR